MKAVKVAKKNRVIRDREKTQVVKWLALKYGVTEAHVYSILRGDEKHGIADDVKKAYQAKYNELKTILEK